MVALGLPRTAECVHEAQCHVEFLVPARTLRGQLGQLPAGVTDLVGPVEGLEHEDLVLGTQHGQVLTKVATPALPDSASAARSSS